MDEHFDLHGLNLYGIMVDPELRSHPQAGAPPELVHFVGKTTWRSCYSSQGRGGPQQNQRVNLLICHMLGTLPRTSVDSRSTRTSPFLKGLA